MELKTVSETFLVVNYNDLNRFIRETTGRQNYNCVALEEWDNDSYHSISVSNEPLDQYDSDFWADFKNRKETGSFGLSIIMNALCLEGKIAPGNYLVHVSW